MTASIIIFAIIFIATFLIHKPFNIHAVEKRWVQEEIVKELEGYQASIDEYEKLIETTKQKIADKIQTVWSSK